MQKCISLAENKLNSDNFLNTQIRFLQEINKEIIVAEFKMGDSEKDCIAVFTKQIKLYF